VSKDSDQTETAPRKFKLGPLGSLNQVTKGLAKTIGREKGCGSGRPQGMQPLGMETGRMERTPIPNAAGGGQERGLGAARGRAQGCKTHSV
jgi:hypothetical protein